MPLKNYSLLKGRALALALDDDDSPHIEIRIEAEGVHYRIAVNARSKVAPHDLLYRHQDPFVHPMTDQLAALPHGVTDIRGSRPELALDYVRGNFVQRDAMSIAPFERVGPANDLRDHIEPLVREGIDDPSIHFYAFGERWGPEPHTTDKYFGFLPGNGIHDIHMNQGSRGRFAWTNGPNQDGALLIHRSSVDRWSAVFLAFQSQAWEADADPDQPGPDPEPEHPEIDPLAQPIRIVAALIDAAGREEGREGVTILNRTDRAQPLDGWQIADRTDRRHALSGTVGAGDTLRVTFGAHHDAPRLGNKGGRITLISPDGVVVQSIEYQKHQVGTEGWTTMF